MVSDDAKAVEVEVREWIERVVVGLGLCPFAKPVLDAGQLEVHVTLSEDVEEGMSAVLEAVRVLVESDDEAEGYLTQMVVTPNLFADFEEYLEILEELEDVLAELGADHLVQIASFHPLYQFEDVPSSDRANFTNRSPYPIFHLLRQEDVEEALDGWREPMQIPERNIALLRQMDADQWEAVFGEPGKE